MQGALSAGQCSFRAPSRAPLRAPLRAFCRSRTAFALGDMKLQLELSGLASSLSPCRRSRDNYERFYYSKGLLILTLMIDIDIDIVIVIVVIVVVIIIAIIVTITTVIPYINTPLPTNPPKFGLGLSMRSPRAICNSPQPIDPCNTQARNKDPLQ